MTDDDRDKLHRLPKVSFNKKTLTKRMRKVESATIRHAHKFIIKRWNNVRSAQRHIIIWILTMGLLIAATGLQLMWYQQSYRTTTFSRDGTYAEAVLGPVDTLNPLFASTSAEQSAGYLMFSSLLRYDKTGNLNHDLATEVIIDTTSTVYTVKIRPDAKWHDGVKLTTKDVSFTVGIMKNPNIRTTITGWKDISAKVIDDTTIEFTLPSAYAAFDHALTFPIIPQHILGDVSSTAIRENDFSNEPIGSGPFKLNFVQDVDSKSDRKVIYLVRNDKYHGGTAKLARFQLHVYKTNDDIVRALMMNEVNAAADLVPANLGHIDKKRYDIVTSSVKSGVYALINTKSVVLNDVVLRRALRLATNTNAIRGKLPIITRQLDLPLLIDQLTGDVPKALAYDLAGAKKILDDSGWTLNAKSVREKDGRELRVSIATMKSNEFENVLESLSGQWRALGVVVSTQILDPKDVSQNVVQNVLQPRNYDVLLYQLNIGADPDVYAYWHSSQTTSSGSNFSNYSNIISDDALVSARARLDPALRNAKYITFSKQWLSDVPAIGLYQATAQYAVRHNVKSYDNQNILISPIDRYSDVLDWSAGSRTVYKTP